MRHHLKKIVCGAAALFTKGLFDEVSHMMYTFYSSSAYLAEQQAVAVGKTNRTDQLAGFEVFLIN